MMDKFIYLKPALSFIMMFIGVKMLLVGSAWEIPTSVSLLVLLFTMVTAVIASMIRGHAETRLRQVKSED
jgi:tellurite resistance protein TerC